MIIEINRLDSENDSGIELIKYNTSGDIEWMVNIQSGGRDSQSHPIHTMVDNSKNTLLCVETAGDQNLRVYDKTSTPRFSFLPGGTMIESYMIPHGAIGGFIKINSNGVVVWANILRGILSYSLKNKIVSTYDSSGNMYVSGNFNSDSLYIYNGTSTTPYLTLTNNNSTFGVLDIYVIKYDSVTGTPLWARKIGGTSNDMVVSIDADSTNNCLYVSGNFTSPTLNMYDANDLVISRFSLSNSSPSNPVNEGFIITYDMHGNVIASRKIVNTLGSGNNTLMTTTLDSSGNIHVSGYCNAFDASGNPLVLLSSQAPTNLSAQADYTDTSIQLSWTAPSNGVLGIPAIQKYKINIYDNSGTYLSTYDPSPSITSSPAIVPGLITGQTYKFSIIATNSVKDSPESSLVTGTPVSIAPAPPTNFTATLSGDQATSVILSWTTPLFGNRPITGYIIEDNSGTVFSGASVVSPYTISNLTTNSSYTYTIKARNDVPLDSSIVISNTVVTGTTAIPTITSIIPSTTSAIVNFSVPHGARVSTTSYRLYRATVSGTTVGAYSLDASGNLTQQDISGNSGLLQFTNRTMAVNTTYSYQIRTFNGSTESSPSNPVQSTAVSLATTMAAPTATAYNGFVRVSWGAPTTNILYYIVQAYTFNANTSATTLLSTTNTWSNSTSFDYPNLINGVYYKFKVQAVNQTGANTESPFSSTEVKPAYVVTSSRFVNIPKATCWQGFAAFDSTQENLYISDTDGKLPAKLNMNTKAITILDISGGVSAGQTYGIALDSSGNIYLSSRTQHNITKYTKEIDGRYTRVSPPIFTQSSGGYIIGLMIDNLNDIYVCGSDGSTAYIYKNGSQIASFTSGSDTWGPGRGIAKDPNGNLYIADAKHCIRKIDTSNNVSVYAGLPGTSGNKDGPALDARITSPFGIAVDSAGNVYFVEAAGSSGAKNIRMIYNKDGQVYVTTLSTLPNSTGDNYLWGLTIDASNNLYTCYQSDEHLWKTFITDLTIPSAIQTINGVAGSNSVTLYWSPPTYNGNSPITSYRIIQYTGPSYNAPIVVATLSFPALLISLTPYHTVTGLQNGTPYKFAVVSTNTQGTSSVSPLSDAYTPVIITTASAPTGVSAVAGNGEATVSWSAPTSNGGTAITSYRVTSYPGGLTATSSTTTASVTGLTNGTAYSFTVVATNAVGSSSSSLASTAVTPIHPVPYTG